MKKCAMILRILNTQEAGQFSQEERLLMEEHLQDCPSCREHRKYMRLTSEVIKDWEVPDVSPKLAKNILEQTRHLSQTVTWREYWGQSRWFPVTAAVAVAASLVLLVGGLSLPVQQQPPTKLIKQHFTLIQGPSLKHDELSIAARALGLEIE